MERELKITECPRDAMQGIKDFIPTTTKIEYINQLLKVGFDTLDFGSFVSPAAIPQMKDTAEVLNNIENKTNTKLLAIVANKRGAEDASKFEKVDVLGFPFSISEEFQLRNTKSTRLESLKTVQNILSITENSGKIARVYLSMAFGNPYQEEWTTEVVLDWSKRLVDLGINELVLSDTVGVANSKSINAIYQVFRKELPEIEINCHFHSKPDEWEEKINTAFISGCYGFDSAIKGYGGCPMAKDDLVGNIATENLISYFEDQLSEKINQKEFQKALILADRIFTTYH